MESYSKNFYIDNTTNVELERTLLIICSESLGIQIPGMPAPRLVKIENPYEGLVIQTFLSAADRISLSFLCETNTHTLHSLHCDAIMSLSTARLYTS